MKTKFILIALLLVTAMVLIAQTFSQTTVGPHGGTVQQVEKYQIEMKNPFPNFYAYLLDNKSKPISNKSISCNVRFFFPDNTSMDAELKQFGDDGFSLESATAKFYACRITFNVFGKNVSARFESESAIVQNNK